MPNGNKAPTICAVCRLPIEPQQRPSVRLSQGKEVHVDCWAKMADGEKSKKRLAN